VGAAELLAAVGVQGLGGVQQGVRPQRRRHRQEAEHDQAATQDSQVRVRLAGGFHVCLDDKPSSSTVGVVASFPS